jgi:hypothetical protein
MGGAGGTITATASGGAGTSGAGGAIGSGGSGTGAAGGRIGSGGTGTGGAGGTIGSGGSGTGGTGGTIGSGGSGTGGTIGSGGSGTGGTGGTIGSGGTSSGGSVGTGGSTADAGPPRPPCLTSGNQVVLIGDSYINWVSHTFPADLNAAAGQTFRMYAVGGYSMGSGGIGLIPPEFDTALAADPNITTVVLSGGGNDVLIPAASYANGAQCKNSLTSPTITDCQTIVQVAIDAAGKLADHMAASGVKDIVYFFYPHVPEGTLVGGLHPNAILDYALPKVKAFCDGVNARTSGKLTCHFVDMVPVFAAHPLDWFAFTDIHPNTLGSAAMAKAVWDTMKTACIAQPASSGCCAP